MPSAIAERGTTWGVGRGELITATGRVVKGRAMTLLRVGSARAMLMLLISGLGSTMPSLTAVMLTVVGVVAAKLTVTAVPAPCPRSTSSPGVRVTVMGGRGAGVSGKAMVRAALAPPSVTSVLVGVMLILGSVGKGASV